MSVKMSKCDCTWLTSEFRWANFLLGYARPREFVTSQWKLLVPLYLVYRWLVALLLLSLAIYMAIGGSKWLIYFTNLTFAFLTATYILRAVAATYYHIKHRNRVWQKEMNELSDTLVEPDTMPWYLKATWVLNNTANTASIIVSLLFWVVLYGGTPMSLDLLAAHALNSVIVLLDQCITASPVRLFHAYHPVVYGILYAVFTVIYYFAGGTGASGKHYIYGMLNYKDNPGLAVGVLLGTGGVAMPVVHFILFCLYKLKVFICKHIAKNQSINSPQHIEEQV